MQFLGADASIVVGGLLIGIALLTLSLLALIVGAVLLGAASVIVFRRTRKVFIPRLTLFLLSFLEAPIKYSLWIFRVDESVIDHMLIQIRNMLYSEAYAKTPFSKRAVFLPQCLRSPNCPAKLTPEGIKCVQCGQCGISEVKKISESLGYMFFIVPGSSFIKRMIKKYRPEALLGVGCPMEVKEGTAMMSSIGIPAQGVMLLKDGCVGTRVNVKDLLAKIHMNNGATKAVPDAEVERVSNAWTEQEPKIFVKVKREIN
jgi:hypothetical protein